MVKRLKELSAVGLTLCLLCNLSDIFADVIYLKDGSKKEGKIVEQTESEVILEVQSRSLKASVRIPMAQIQSIEKKKSPLEEYAEMLAALNPDDAEGFHKLGLWCQEKNLPDKAEECFRKAIEISPSTEKAGIKLGLVRVKNKWYSVDEIRSMAASKFDSQNYEEATKLLEHLKPLPADRMDSLTRRRVFMDLARCYECKGEWQRAIAIYDDAVKCASKKPDIALARVRQSIIAQNPDGNFDCAPDLTMFKSVKEQREQKLLGKQSLMRPEVLDFAVRVEANKILQEAKDGMDKAAEQTRFNPEEAKLLYAQVDALAQQADYLVPDISRPLRFKIATVQGKILDTLADKSMKEVQADPGYNKAQGYPGRLDQAQAYVRKVESLCGYYQEKIDLLRPFSEQAGKEIDAALAALAKVNAVKAKAAEALNQLIDQQEIERLEEIIATSYAKAKAINPSNRDFKYGYDTFKDADGLYHFVDDGKTWRARSDACIAYCEKALDAAKKKLELCRKYPAEYRADMTRTKTDMIRIYEMMMSTIANKDRKGDETRH